MLAYINASSASLNSPILKQAIPNPNHDREELPLISQDFTKIAFASPHYSFFKNKFPSLK